jgi:hypothetical protein
MKREACDLPSLLFSTIPIFTSLPAKDITSACEFDFCLQLKLADNCRGYPCKIFLKTFLKGGFYVRI